MKTLLIVLIATLALVAAPETDVTGKWSGTFVVSDANGETKDSTALLMLKQTGSDISGSVGPNEGEQHAIKKGNIDRDKITLLVEDEGRVINFDLILAADRIRGDARMSHDGQTATAKLDVTRAK